MKKRKPPLNLTLAHPERKGAGITVIIHGIHTSRKAAADWMPQLGRKIHNATGSGIALFRYGWTSGVSIRLPLWGLWSRRSKLARLRRLIRKLQAAYPGERINIVAHSFGTWLGFWAGILGKERKRVDIHRLALMAPIIDVDEVPPAAYGPRRIACLFSRSDDVIRTAPFGHAGAWGFATADGKRVVNIDLTAYEHADYTEPGRAWDQVVAFLLKP